ncbi:MAG TPA: hypothetical protein VK484_04515 [Ferruginibacter sp.]|nr:hypothetical protein [Ferruginibacter sp.]
MKKHLLLISLFISSITYAQVPEDAIRFSFYPQNGTARNLAIGGAMGSLGGDLNATFVNPAGLGFYKTGEFVLTPGFLLNNNKISYREAASQNKKDNFALGTTGLVLGYGSRYKKNTSNALSFAVTQTANFNNHIQYKGLNNYSSFSEQFAEEFAKSGYSIDDVLTNNSSLPYTSAPALYTYLIDTVTVNGNIQVKGVPEYILDAGQALQQEMIKTTKGGITEIAIGYAHNKNDKWYIGATLAVPIINYSSHTIFKESDTSANTANNFKQFEYTDNFTTKGIGANAKIGIIYRPKDYIRIGLAIHTPSFMSLKDTRTTSLTTQLERPYWNSPYSMDTTITISSREFTNNQPGESRYSQNTPFKAILSASYVFRETENVKKQRAFITADIEYVHHRGSKFGSQNEEPTEGEKEYYKALTRVIKASYKGNFNFRVGGELKFNVFMARLGFAYYGNPYKDAALKARRMLLSGGLGYRNKGMFIDITYVHAMNKDVDFPYRLEDRANTYATLKQQRGNAVATVGFKF